MEATSVQKITLMGPASTGKTTLCEALAKKYHTTWVPEYLRLFAQKKWDEQQAICALEDVIPILQGHLQLEAKYTPLAQRFLFLDTNPLTSYIYSLFYFNKVPDEIIQACLQRDKNEYYLLTATDVPYEFDVLRDRPEERDNIFYSMKQELVKRQLPFSVISGSIEERLEKIDAILATMLSC